MPPPPRMGDIIREMVLEHLSCYEPKTIPQVYWEILNDFGSVSERTVLRQFRALSKEKKIFRVGSPGWEEKNNRQGSDIAYKGYVRSDARRLSLYRDECNLVVAEP